ncbi:MAG: molybdenum cofactor biosynthesis protein MoaE [Actinomycetota bacterium]
MIQLTHEPIDAAAVAAAVEDPEHGGAVVFIGTTRREAADREVVALEYEAYEELAVRELEAIAEEVRARFGAAVAIVHRLGRVEAGEPSVVVAASTPHRPAAFAACRFGIDELKERVPIWKRTVHADGDATWVDGRDAATVRGGGPA